MQAARHGDGVLAVRLVPAVRQKATSPSVRALKTAQDKSTAAGVATRRLHWLGACNPICRHVWLVAATARMQIVVLWCHASNFRGWSHYGYVFSSTKVREGRCVTWTLRTACPMKMAEDTVMALAKKQMDTLNGGRPGADDGREYNAHISRHNSNAGVHDLIQFIAGPCVLHRFIVS